MSVALRVARYRFGVTFRRWWGGYLALVLLIGLLGGVAMTAVAGARRTQSSFPAYLASTNPSELQVGTGIFDPQIGSTSAYDAGLIARIAHLPHVKHVATFTGFNPEIVVLKQFPSHAPLRAGEQPPGLTGSVDGAFTAQDRVTVTEGRLANPKRIDEVVATAGAAQEAGLHVGSVVPIGVFTNAQLEQPGCCSAEGSIKPYRRIDLKLVGTVVFNGGVVQDDVDALGAQAVLFTPEFTHRFRACCAYFSQSLVQLERGSRDVNTVKAELSQMKSRRAVLNGVIGIVVSGPAVAAKAERAIKPEAIALGVFGVIAAIAVLLIAAQLIGRQLRAGAEERNILRALGADTAMTVSDGLVGILGAVIIGSLLAAVVAVGLSPFAPLGPARPVDPHPGVAIDATILGAGVVLLIIVLSAIAVAIAYGQAPHRATHYEQTGVRASRLARGANALGLPAPTVTGIRFALEPGAGRTAVPVRSAILGTVMAMVVVTATVTFGASFNTLVSHPALYGWNWDYELLSGYAGNQDLPEHQTAALLRRDRYVAASAGVYFASLKLDGVDVPVIGGDPHATVAPPLLSGHGVDAGDQVVLGATTLAQLHKHVGDTVVLDNGTTRTSRLRIVGTATMPTIGTPGNLHPTMGEGALLSYQLIPSEIRNIQQNAILGPNAVLIRLHHGMDRSAALRSLQKINATLNAGPDGAGGVSPVQRPAEIVNFRSQQSTPAYLGAVLAVGALSALALTLIASGRRRRRDLALLKTLGFTRRQLGAVVAWQSSVAVGIGILIGVPVGIVLGRWLWALFAHAIHAVPGSTVPALTIELIAVGALLLANLVAAVPARRAARTQTAVLLRAE